MKTYKGKSVFNGIAIGKICVYKKDEQQVKRSKIMDVEGEIQRFHKARETAIEQLQGLYEKALTEVGEANAAIFEIHQMMLFFISPMLSLILFLRYPPPENRCVFE